MAMKYSYSRVDTYVQCPYKYKLRYIDNIKVDQDVTYDNPLLLGTTLHTVIQEGLEIGTQNYYDAFPMINDLQINEMSKLEQLYPKILAALPTTNGLAEVKIENDEFIGYMDWLVPVNDDTYDLYDFKYSNNANRYVTSKQLHIYKYYFEKVTGKHIRDMYFLVVPKTAIRQKKNETLFEFRERLKDTVNDLEVTLIPIKYDPLQVQAYLDVIEDIETDKDFHKNITRLCDYCEYQDLCTNTKEEN